MYLVGSIGTIYWQIARKGNMKEVYKIMFY